jgi:single-stranded-DNA-specific exonuclease
MAPWVIRQRALPAGECQLPPDLHPVIRRVMLARGVTCPQPLRLQMTDMLSPNALSGIEPAADLLADAVTSERSILVVGDFDADGATGTTVAVLALQAMGCSRVDFRVPNRFEFGYGLTVPLVDTLTAAPPDVLITVDSGISCVNGVARARELGCKVVITDHHLPGKVLPSADAIVNPNCTGDPFPSKAMAGVGVVFYLAGVVRQKLRQRGWFSPRRPEPVMAQWLDLVALGTVADLVPLDHNNRILVRQGLERIRRGLARPGLMALLRAGKRDYRYVSASDLGFAVAPRLNAAGRLEDMSIGIRCLLSDDREEANRLAIQLDDLNQQRRDMQEQMQIEAMQQVRELIASLQREQDLPAALCLHDDSWHQGIVGLLASKVKDAVHRPVIAFAPESAGSDLLKGSARSIKGLHIRDVLALVDANVPGLMHAFGGHAMAAGLSLNRSALDLFRQNLQQAVVSILDGASPAAELLTDGELKPEEIGMELAVQIQDFGPWGQRFPEPLFDGRFEVLAQRVVGGSHLRLTVRALGGREVLEAIAFNHSPEDLPAGSSIRLLYRLDVNRWRGNETCQLMVEKIVPENGAE